MDLHQAKQVLVATHLGAIRHDTRANAIEMISGPGIGKSETAVAYCTDLAQQINKPVGLITFMLATISSVDVRGFMLPTKPKTPDGPMGSAFSTPPWFPTQRNIKVAMPDGAIVERGDWQGELPEHGVLFLDEFGQSEDEVKKAAAELLLHGEVGDTKLPRGWRVLAASNRMSDRSGVMRSLMFVVNRRAEILVDASLPAWLTWANAQKPHIRPHYLLLSFAQKNPDLVFRDKVPDGSDPFCTPRTLCLLNRDLMSLRSAEDEKLDRIPLDPLSREIAAGWIGKGEAAQLFSHLRYADEIPDMKDIERDAMKAKLPPNRDAQLVLSYMLAHNVTEKNAKHVIKYLGRMNVEMQVCSVRAITAQSDQSKAAAITGEPEFVSWLAKHKQLLIDSRS
jgi:hypothetical protein